MSFKHLIRMAPGSPVSNLLKQNPFDPSKLEGLVAWYDFSDASTITTTSGTPGTPGEAITAVVNKSADASPYPSLSGGAGTFTAAGINGRTSLGGYMDVSPYPAVGDLTIMCAAKRRSYSALIQLFNIVGYPASWAWLAYARIYATESTELIGLFENGNNRTQPFPNPFYFANAEAMNFDGVDDAAHSNTIVPVDSGFTVAFWVRDSGAASANNGKILLSQGPTSGPSSESTMYLRVQNDTEISFRNADPGFLAYSTRSMLFDGDGGNYALSTAAIPAVDIEGAFSVSFWAKILVAPVDDYVIYIGNPTSDTQARMRIALSGTPQFYFQWFPGENPSVSTTSGITVAVGNWYHVVVTSDSTALSTGTMRCYINNVAGNTAALPITAPAVSPPYNVQIAKLANHTAYNFPGNVDEVSVWSKALSVSEIDALWGGGVPTNLTGSAGLISWWKMGESLSGTTIPDQVGSVDLTLYGSPVAVVSTDVPSLQLDPSLGAFSPSYWTHVAVTCAGTTAAAGDAILYIDGVDVASDTLAGPLLSTSNQLKLAGDAAGGGYADVDMDEVAAWTSVLTPLQVKQLYGTDTRYSTRSINFDGATQNAVAAVGIGAPGLAGVSVSFWARWDGVATGRYPFCLGSSGGGGSGLRFRVYNDSGSGGRWACQSWNDTGSGPPGGFAAANSSLSTDWVHIVLTDTADTTAAGIGTFYLNGSVSGTPGATLQVNPAIGAQLVELGAIGAAYWFGGNIDEVSVWSKVLDLAEVQALYAGGQPQDLTGSSDLVGWYRCGEDVSGATIPDQVGSADLTMAGSPVVSADVPYVHATSSNGVGEIVDLTKHSANATLNRWYRFGEDTRGDFVDSATVGPYDLIVDNDPTVTSTTVIPGPVAPVPANIATLSRDGTSGEVKFHLDNAPVVSGLDSATGDMDGAIVTWQLGSSYSQQIGEVLIFDRVITDAERSACQDYLTSKYLNHGQLDFSDLVNSGYTIDL